MIAFLSSFTLVFTKAFQQQNVTHNLYVSAFLTSFLVATGEVGVIVSGATMGWGALPYIACGGGVGVVLAMYSHKRIFKKIHAKL